MRKLLFLTLLIFSSAQSKNENKETKLFYKKMGFKKKYRKVVQECKVVNEALSDIASQYDNWFFDIDHTRMRKFFLENREKLSVSEKEAIKKTFPLIIPEMEKKCTEFNASKGLWLFAMGSVGCFYIGLRFFHENEMAPRSFFKDKEKIAKFNFFVSLVLLFEGAFVLYRDRQERTFKRAKEYLQEVLAYCTKN